MPPAELATTRAEVHYAAEVVAAGSRAWLPPRPGWSHLAMHWDGQRAVFLGPRLPGGGRFAVGVLAATVSRLDRGGQAIDTLDLAGRTMDEALGWLRRTAPIGLAAPTPRLGQHLPQSAHAEGGTFGEADPAARAELARWIGDLDLLLAELARARGAPAGTSWWPHHLDGAVRLSGGHGPDVSGGLSLGDRQSLAPYLYVTAAALPDSLPPLRHGEWHTGSWQGAWLPGERLAALPPTEQPGAARTFLEEAIDALQRDAGRP
ncbi:MAG TPA: hypothetical protein VFK38_10380 [Candidatus Limnocylindrales bacterium]|nr:hypothetical protein [Candidatus Limnocylindrales bacterium]